MKIPKALVGWKVLVVDDEDDSRDVARRFIKKAGATVREATNGKQALEMVEDWHPDFILSDLSMPEMDGWQFMAALNNNRATSEIPVIALTAHAMEGDRKKAIMTGFVNYITKPLDPDKFVAQLLAILIDIPKFTEQLQSYRVEEN